ncbi:methionine--tRNA ligase [Sulfolobales archaeon HS-7]|nr:methionine--tRNA ligase [Sulfolobales archaeon HS-7]
MTKVIVASAWPYVNAVPHLGTILHLLSGDVMARYAKLKYGKENVIYVSGSDEHGTPIEIEARKRGVEPKSLTDQAHEYDKSIFDSWEIQFSNYSRTESQTHKEFVRSFLLELESYIKVEEEVIPYCSYDKIFLPDRFIKGTCPYCGFEDARGDQCDKCGRLLNPSSLVNPKCAICNKAPIFTKTKQWFFDLSSVEDKLRHWLESNDNLPKNVRTTALSWINEGLKPRSLTRDNKWGIPAPFKDAEEKTIYVWFEALLGYISSSIEYFAKQGNKDEWKSFWFGKDTKSYYFLGKDNIVFHAIILPAMLMASGKEYNLPNYIAATEYLLYEGQKFSKSRRIGIWADEAPRILPPEYWRFLLIRNRPEEKDMNFTWREAVRIINSELNDDIGNLVQRVLTLVDRFFNNAIPVLHKDKLNDTDKKVMEKIPEIYTKITEDYEKALLKQASENILELARLGNGYLNDRKPWDIIKASKEEAGNVIYIALLIIRVMALSLYPILPTSSQEIFNMLGLGLIEEYNWNWAIDSDLPSGNKIGKYKPLFNKLESDFDKKVEELLSRIREDVETQRPTLLK